MESHLQNDCLVTYLTGRVQPNRLLKHYHLDVYHLK